MSGFHYTFGLSHITILLNGSFIHIISEAWWTFSVFLSKKNISERLN